MPLIGTEVFGLAGNMAVFSFIIAFGLAKALTNLAAGALTARFRRRRLLLVGWLIGVPVPFALAWAPSRWWIVAANVLLGINQGLTWSMTVNMKIDLVGPARRGLATGLNEAAGYVSVGVTALLTGYPAGHYGLRPAPELIGAAFVAAGLALSLSARATAAHLPLELTRHPTPEFIDSLSDAVTHMPFLGYLYFEVLSEYLDATPRPQRPRITPRPGG
ncbi:MFS transporter [Streptomyces sp. NPDC015232]|uniref:MFS transporter n=1 Tax=unclassified Streptomyces TaxID=2593676 RepID=UPI0036FE341D